MYAQRIVASPLIRCVWYARVDHAFAFVDPASEYWGLAFTRKAGFGVLVTMDRNLEHQQNISRAGLGLLVVLTRDNRVETVVPLGAHGLRNDPLTHRSMTRPIRAVGSWMPGSRARCG